jgi:hypothetical protein
VPLGGGWHLSIGLARHAVVAARRMKRRLPWHTLATTINGLTCIGRVAQHGVDHGPAPVRLTGRAWNPAVAQAPANLGQRQSLVPDPSEDLAHDPRRRLVDLVACGSSTGLARDVAVAEGRPRQDTDSTGLGAMALAAPTALQHFGPLVLGEHALQLQQQAVLGRGPDRAIEEDDLGAGLGELLDQQNLMRVAAGEAIRGMDVDEINR